MKRLMVLFTVALCAVSGARASSPLPNSVTTLLRLEHTWQQAVSSGDKQTLRNILADNFLDTSYKGELRTKDEIVASVNGNRHYNAVLSDLKVRLFGDTAIVTGLNTVTGRGQAWTAQVRFTDIFVKRNNRWQAIGAQESIIRRASGPTATNG